MSGLRKLNYGSLNSPFSKYEKVLPFKKEFKEMVRSEISKLGEDASDREKTDFICMLLIDKLIVSKSSNGNETKDTLLIDGGPKNSYSFYETLSPRMLQKLLFKASYTALTVKPLKKQPTSDYAQRPSKDWGKILEYLNTNEKLERMIRQVFLTKSLNPDIGRLLVVLTYHGPDRNMCKKKIVHSLKKPHYEIIDHHKPKKYRAKDLLENAYQAAMLKFEKKSRLEDAFRRCLSKQEKMKEKFLSLSRQELLKMLFSMSQELSPFTEIYRLNKYRLQMDSSDLFIKITLDGGKMEILAQSEDNNLAAIAAILISIYQDEPPEVISQCPPKFLDEIESLKTKFTELSLIYKHMKQAALKFY
ncbi:MAG: hypothetical protein K1060chlam2_00432 [Chlamydiae bacterium]|nr:hypothetical protein [Chlamydiota bacterium]